LSLSQPTPSEIERTTRRQADSLAQSYTDRIWDEVSHSPLSNLWSFEGAPTAVVWKRVLHATLDDNLLSRAAELGYYFLFALFPTLVCASSILGLAARSAQQIYENLLHYLTLVVPPAAYGLVIETFNQTAAASTTGKITLGLAAALWSASVGFSAIQDGMNTVYKVRESRPYWKARGSAILVTVLLALMVSINLAVLLIDTLWKSELWVHIANPLLARTAIFAVHAVMWTVATGMLLLQFGTIYYFAPNLKNKCWRWVTPGAALGVAGWLVASLGLKLYLYYFNSFSLTYGSLGAVIVLLTWFYITGLMMLLGGEINSEIQAAVMERRLKAAGEISPAARAEMGVS
jgi:membrane protein